MNIKRFLTIIFGGKEEKNTSPVTISSINVQRRADEVMRGTDENSRAIHKRANKTQGEYATVHRQAKKVLKESEKLVKIIDTLSAVAIETGGRERGFKG